MRKKLENIDWYDFFARFAYRLVFLSWFGFWCILSAGSFYGAWSMRELFITIPCAVIFLVLFILTFFGNIKGV